MVDIARSPTESSGFSRKLAALIIIVVGLGPVIFLNSTLQRVSQKKESN